MSNSDVVEKKVKRELEFKLSDKERHAKLEKLAEFEDDIDAKSVEVKAAQKKFKADTKELQKSRQQLRKELKTNSELRNVTCTELKNFSAGIVQLVYGDEVKHERTLEAHERQESLIEPKKKPGNTVIVRKKSLALKDVSSASLRAL